METEAAPIVLLEHVGAFAATRFSPPLPIYSNSLRRKRYRQYHCFGQITERWVVACNEFCVLYQLAGLSQVCGALGRCRDLVDLPTNEQIGS